MKKHKLKLYESQVAVLREMLGAQDNFLQEAKGFTQMIQEGTGDEAVLTEGLSDSFQKLMQKGGFSGLKRAVMAAVTAGSLMGVSDAALAQAATQAGATPQQAKELAMVTKSSNNGGQTATVNPKAMQFAKELTKLNQRFVVADGTQNKDFMKFTGNINDVVGIEPKNGYPIFAKGSDSEKRLEAAFASPKVIKGVVNVRGQEFAGTFIKNDGLYYTIQGGDGAASGQAQTSAAEPAQTATASTAPASQDAAVNNGNKEQIDFTGLFQQAQIRYKQYQKADGSITDGGKTFSDFRSYVPEFLRKNGAGFENMSDGEIQQMFSKGLKAWVEKGKFQMGGKTRPTALNR